MVTIRHATSQRGLSTSTTTTSFSTASTTPLRSGSLHSDLVGVQTQATTAIMARAHRVAAVATFLVIAYLLTLYNFLSVPLVDAKTAEQILPVVRWIDEHTVAIIF